MLMALLVASLLLAALAPVMTKRMDEAKLNISGVGAAQYDKDSIISIFTGAPDEDKVFNVPNDVNMIKATLIGGGGAGGNSFYGKGEVTTSKSWTVPEGVTKLRVFMLGGGGGGASGGVGVGTAYGKLTQVTETLLYEKLGEVSDHSLTLPNGAKIPELDFACKSSGITAWNNAINENDTKLYKPGEYLFKVTACGGGGGGGGTECSSTETITGGGGSGGYIEKMFVVSSKSTIYVKVGGGGGGGGTCSSANAYKGANGGCFAGGGGGLRTGIGGSGGSCASISGGKGGTGFGVANEVHAGLSGSSSNNELLSYGGNGGVSNTYYAEAGGRGAIWAAGGGASGGTDSGGGGGGGGGPTTISTASGTSGTILFQIGGGGGGGGDGSYHYTGGGGGGGGGYGAGGGGGGGGKNSAAAYGTGSTILSGLIDNIVQNGKNGGIAINTAESVPYPGKACVGGGGGGGGSGYGGSPGGASGDNAGGVISKSLFANSYCSGGDGGFGPNGTDNSYGKNGKPGAIRITYGDDRDLFKCQYSLPANGSGGGGAGQLVVGEINVTAGETLYFEIGGGGASQTAAGKNGNAGYSTKIRRGGPSGTVIAEALGGLAGQYSSAESTESQGGGYRTNLAIGTNQTLTDNWTGISFNQTSNAGSNGKLANALINKGYGGAGGNSVNIKGETLNGGSGGNSVKNGASPDIKSYGAGGGGGSGAQVAGDSHGVGASGASGYIYFEYGGTNGGGGTAGEILTKTITNLKAGTEIKINVGEGGDIASSGNGAPSTIEYQGGSTPKTLSAKGGIRGNDGGMGVNEQAGVKMLPNTFANYKTDENAPANGHAATETYGGIGGYIEELYQNPDNTWATYIKAKDGTIAGPVLGGCGGNLTALMSAITCNDAANTPNGKNGTFGGGGGGGAVINEIQGKGGKGGRGVIILEYKSTAL